MTTPSETTGFGSWTTGEPAGPLYCKDDELDYSNWENNEPNNANIAHGREDCVEVRPYTIMNGDGVWNDLRCSYRNNYLCEKGKNVFLHMEVFSLFPETFSNRSFLTKFKAFQLKNMLLMKGIEGFT